MRSVLAVVLASGLAGSAVAQLNVPFFDKTPGAKPVDPAKTDADALAAVGLKADDPKAVLAYFQRRTLSDDELKRILGVIKRMGDEDFEERERAAAELAKVGEAAIGPLRTAQQDDDPEVGFRAGVVLKKLEKTVSHTAVALAAVRAVGKAKPADGAKVLLAYLPVADTPAVEEEIRTALIGLAVRDGTADPSLVAALTDPLATRRGAAVVALLEGGDAKQRIRNPAVYPQVKAAVLAEPNPDTKFRGLFALLTVARDPDGVPALCDLLPSAERGRVWQIEDYLIQLGGANPPKIRTGGSAAGLVKARDEWKQWWDGAKKSVNLEALAFAPKTTGSLVIECMDRPGSWGNARVMELGPDLKEKWKFGGLQAPLDCDVTADGRIMILEQSYSRITERDRTGRILVTRAVQNQPVGFQSLPNGNTLVVFRHQMQEFDKDWKPTPFAYARQTQDLFAARRLPNGTTIALCQNTIVKIDAQGKELPDQTKTGQLYWQPRLEVVNEDRVIVTEQQKVAEYDLKAKKEVWKFAVNNATSVQRLANGNTLIVDGNANPTSSLREVSPEGEVVWTYAPADGMRIHRAERR